MALMRVNDYRRTHFLRPPAAVTVRKWAKAGEIYGEQHGRLIYVDPDRDPKDSPMMKEAQEQTSDPDVAALVARAGG